jgi:DNA-binding NarL/FixJ family response regulator
MRELVASLIAQQPDLEVVGELSDEKDLVTAVETLMPDVLVVGLDESDQVPPICTTILAKRPDMKILGVAAEKNTTVCFWADVEVRSRAVENSERGLLEAIRGKPSDSVFFVAPESRKPN